MSMSFDKPSNSSSSEMFGNAKGINYISSHYYMQLRNIRLIICTSFSSSSLFELSPLNMFRRGGCNYKAIKKKKEKKRKEKKKRKKKRTRYPNSAFDPDDSAEKLICHGIRSVVIR